MGTGEKKKRREINGFLNSFLLRDGENSYPLREHHAARDMIAEFAEPMKGLFETTTTRYSVAVFAWNLSLAEEDRRGELMESFLEPLVQGNEEGLRVLTDLIESLVDRRETLYPQETLLILPDESYVPPEVDDEVDDEGGE
ncbi:MAG: hypothetical protein HN368_11040 [Spirochaetales bacterium]|jgi:hypothetical protein|nr:hypothetical protein [Spirochaetales bacterium]